MSDDTDKSLTPIPGVPGPVYRPGWKTTEAWLTLLAWLLAAVLESGLFSETGTTVKVVAFAAAALAQLGYVVSRTAIKKG